MTISPAQHELNRLLAENARLVDTRLRLMQTKYDAEIAKVKNRSGVAKWRTFCVSVGVLSLAIHSSITAADSPYDWLRGIAIGLAAVTAIVVWFD